MRETLFKEIKIDMYKNVTDIKLYVTDRPAYQRVDHRRRPERFHQRLLGNLQLSSSTGKLKLPCFFGFSLQISNSK